MPRRPSLAHAYSKWLFSYAPGYSGEPAPLVDRFNWGWTDAEGNIVQNTKVRLNDFLNHNALMPPKLEGRLCGESKVYTTSHRGSCFALIMIDFDQHHGETDAADAARWVRHHFFEGCYDEPSGRGHHLHPVVWRRWLSCERFNETLRRLKADLSVILKAEGFEATVDVTGSFMERDGGTGEVTKLGTLAALPRLPKGWEDFKRLTGAPVFLPAAFEEVGRCSTKVRLDHRKVNEGMTLHDTKNTSKSLCTTILPTLSRCVPVVSGSAGTPEPSSDAFKRMHDAVTAFLRLHRRLPRDVDELLGYYQDLYQTGAAHPARRRRARYVLAFRSEGFDPESLPGDEPYIDCREEMLSVVRMLCKDRSNPRRWAVDDESLAAYLYLVTVNSFSINETPELQWTLPNASAAAFFAALKAAGVADIECGEVQAGRDNRPRWVADHDRLSAMKVVLVRARLAECLDATYVYTEDRTGIGKKYTVGPAHWRWAEFLWFAESVRYERAIDVRKGTTSGLPVVRVAPEEMDWEDAAEVSAAELAEMNEVTP